MTLDEAWRARLSSHHALWTSPLLMPGAGTERPLEQIALPLSVSGAGPEQVLSVDLVLGRRSVVVGPAGSGKTTSLRLLFRELLADDRALPLLLDLRTAPTEPIDDWLEQQLAVRVPEARGVSGALASVALGEGPRPVLLLDGWDELGEAAIAVREQLLGLASAWPRLDIVVGSRPVARGLPRVGEGFQHLVLQPLGAEDLAELTGRLVALTMQEGAQDAARTAFMSLLAANPAVMHLARRPLLLQLLLLMGNPRELPVRRDALYRDVVTTLLTMRTLEQQPTQALEQIAALAWRLQLHGHGAWTQVLAESLPEQSPQQRTRTLAWICGTTGMLEPVDGGFRFPHPVLREYLAARHLCATVSAARRPARVRALSNDPRHWEVLRLWLAMVEAGEPGMTDELVEQIEELPLVVALLADGLGSDDRVAQAAGRLREALGRGWPSRVSACSTALASSGHSDRVRAFGQALVQGAERLGWPAWLRVRELVHDGDLGVEVPPPVRPEARMVLDAIGGKVELQGELAVGRMLSAASPLWPGVPWEAALLWTWPSRRPMRARWLQRLAGLGWTVEQLRDAPPPPPCRDGARWLRTVRDEWTGRLDDHGTYIAAEHWAHVLARTDPMAAPPLGRDAVLELLAETTTPPRAGGVVALMRAAARVARGGRAPLARLLRQSSPDPLWPALARVVAGQGTSQDRALLVQAASDPTTRDGGLSDGLRYIVRGDVWTVDGVVTLEELGVELPLLD